MKIAITCESTVDLPQEILKKYNIQTLPFTVILGEKEYADGDVTFDDIYQFVQKNKVLPKTSAINKAQFQEFFAKQLESADAVVHISLSSKISSACQNAKDVAAQMQNVFVIDSLSLSTGIALLAIHARELANAGLDAAEVAQRVSARVPSVQASFVIERLDYLYKGGRCSALAYFGANLMKIRPSILVKDGQMGSHKKYRGSMEKVVENYCEDTLKEFSTPDLTRAFVTHTTATPEMVAAARKALEKRGFKEILDTTAGATISSHCGEHTLGILFINDGKHD